MSREVSIPPRPTGLPVSLSPTVGAILLGRAPLRSGQDPSILDKIETELREEVLPKLNDKV